MSLCPHGYVDCKLCEDAFRDRAHAETTHLLSTPNNASRLRESVNRIRKFDTNLNPDVKPITPQENQPDIYQMIIDQNPELRTEQRKPVTSLDWELQQAIIHLQNAISVTGADRAHKLITAKNIVKGVRESD